MGISKLFRLIVLTMLQVMGGTTGILTEVAEDLEYDKNTNRPTGKSNGTKYSVACPARQYMTINVKVPSGPIITKEELEAATEPIYITFEGFEGRFYNIDNNIGLSCRADKAAIVADKKQTQKVSG